MFASFIINVNMSPKGVCIHIITLITKECSSKLG